MTDLISPFACCGCSSVEDVAPSEAKNYYSNSTRLFKAIELHDWGATLNLLNRNSAEASKWVVWEGVGGIGSWRRLPIHEACMRQPREAVIEALIKSYPQGVREKDSDGQLPLHHACASGASAAVVLKLLHACPDALDVKNNWGNLPIDIAETTSCPQEVIKTLKKRPSYYAVQAYANVRKEDDERMKQEFIKQVEDEKNRDLDVLRQTFIREQSKLKCELSAVTAQNERLRSENSEYRMKEDQLLKIFQKANY